IRKQPNTISSRGRWLTLTEIGPTYDEKRAEVAIIAALLHDVGHGPFSHTFETVQQSLGVRKHHEKWTAEIIRNTSGAIQPLLETYWSEGGFCDAVADLLEAEDPTDIYHAVVSSSFDADRLDYLRRDRLMTGTGAGAIDFDWLMENVRVGKIAIEAPDGDGDEHSVKVETFCIDMKALPAAEQFLLARYTLHEQVYFHKTTRCIEHMIAKLLGLIAEHAAQPTSVAQTGLDISHPLISFFKPDNSNLTTYLALDDVVITGALEELSKASDIRIADLAERLRNRHLYKTLDVAATFGYDPGVQVAKVRWINKKFSEKLACKTVILDEGASINIYTQIGGDDERAHKKLHILDPKEGPVEITKMSSIIRPLSEAKKKFTRYYFESGSDRNHASPAKGEI
ncbi:MAG TPA: HD domain-containing protein, partial [Opitutales bacterium]|nr:HD domain-containing protein [Acidocella sp.]HQU09581.1 HD domain-containing protein [Opitutales bacterium]